MTTKPLKIILLRCSVLLGVLALVFALRVNSQILPDAPIEGIQIPMFSEEGYKLWNMKGSSAAYKDDGGVEVKELDLEIYQGEEAKEVDMHILGAEAVYASDDRTITGDGGVFVDGDFYDIEGDSWKYSLNERVVQVTSNVKVVIDYELESFLK